jgi:hypothetical protein
MPLVASDKHHTTRRSPRVLCPQRNMSALCEKRTHAPVLCLPPGFDREREQPKMIMMRPMAARWAVAGTLKIIDCLLKPTLLGLACSALGKPGQGRASGSSQTRTRLRVPVGASLQFNGGEMAEPSANALEFRRIQCLKVLRVPPPCGHRNKWLAHLRQSVLPKPLIAIGRCERAATR